MSIRLGKTDLAKYPFLIEASEFIRQSHLGIEEFNRPEMEYIVDRAVERLECEIRNGQVYRKLDKYEIEVLTFLIALVVTKMIGVEAILRKHSLFEAMRAEIFLIQDLKIEKDERKKRLLLSKIFKELFSIDIDINPENKSLYRIRITQYLLRASDFHEEEWKLVNKSVQGGYVHLDGDEIARLVRNELSNLIYARMKAMSLPSIPKVITERVNHLSTRFSSYYASKTFRTLDHYPPCIEHAITMMNKNENLPHSARLMLATYMLAVGKSEDDIVTLFHNAPDFNEKVTRYQVEHLAGMKGSHTRYYVPSCAKLRAQNLCFQTEECDGIINPVQFRHRLKNS